MHQLCIHNNQLCLFLSLMQSHVVLCVCRISSFLLRPNTTSYMQSARAAGLAGNSFLPLSLTFAFYCLLGAPAPLQQSIHPLLQPSSLWWVSCHCLSLQLWTQLPEPDGPISTSSSLSHGVYKGASEPEATADWPWSVEISLSQNNMPREVEKNCLQCNSQCGTTLTDNVAFIVLECEYVFSTWLRFD